MHELALAEGVIVAALNAAREQGMSRIEKIEVKIGELQQIERELFEYSLKEILPATDARIEKADIVLQTEKALFRCRVCSHEFSLADATGHLNEEQAEAIHFIPELAHTYLCCPGCRSPDFEVVKGRGVWIEALEGI